MSQRSRTTTATGLASLPGFLVRRVLLMAGNSPLLAAVYARRCSPRVLIVGVGTVRAGAGKGACQAKGTLRLCNAIGAVKKRPDQCPLQQRGARNGQRLFCAQHRTTLRRIWRESMVLVRLARRRGSSCRAEVRVDMESTPLM